MPKVHPSHLTNFENFKLGALAAATLIQKLTSLGVVGGLMTAEKLTSLPVMTIYQDITKAIKDHAKYLVNNEEMVLKSSKLVEHVNYVVESLKGAEFSDDCPAFPESVKCLATLYETIANWESFSASKKKYMVVSLVDTTTLAKSYNIKFCADLAAVRASMHDLLQAVNAKSFAKIGELNTVVKEGIGALHKEHVAVNLSLVELKGVIDEASVALSDFERSLAEKLGEIKDGQDQLKAGQVELKGDLKAAEEGVKHGLKVVEEGVKHDLKAVEEGVKHDLKAVGVEVKAGQEELKHDLKAVEENLGQFKAGQEELKMMVRNMSVVLPQGAPLNPSLLRHCSAPSAASIPITVPDLPNAYMVREIDLQLLTNALLRECSHAAALTSQKGQQQKKNKVGAHGMGGVGKTTIAVALVHNIEVRKTFEVIAWVSIGQEPNIIELQSSIHVQLTDYDLESGMSSQMRMQAIRKAAKGRSLLLVLDDVWDAKHEKELNCVDLDTNSKVLVTTRISGLLRNTSEVQVGVLTQSDSRAMLLSAAEMSEEDLDEKATRLANEVVELCGRLPLTLTIAGGIVASNQGFSDGIVELMKEDYLRGEDDEEGLNLEDRIIHSSLEVLRKERNGEMLVKVFLSFAIFPEDVPVPSDVFHKLATFLSGEKKDQKARLVVGGCLKQLLKFNLIKGSLQAKGGGDGGGVYMHDIVRDFVIKRNTAAELRSLHEKIVEAFFSVRPQPDGFPIAAHAPLGTLEGYVARQLYVHMKGALKQDDGTHLGPPDSWLTHPDIAIKVNAAKAVGSEALVVLSKQREHAGELVPAARAAWVSSLCKDILADAFNDQVHRAAALLEKADDEEARAFELEVLSVACFSEQGSERALKAFARQKALATSSDATFESKTGEAIAAFTEAMSELGVFGGEGSIEAAMPSMRAHSRIILESADLAPNASLKMSISWWAACVMGYFTVASLFEQWHDFGCSEDQLVQGIEFYTFHECGRILDENFMKFDTFRYGELTIPLALLYGNLEALDMWQSKTFAACQEIDLASSKDYASEVHTMTNQIIGPLYLFVMLGQFGNAFEFLKACGFTWSKEGLENCDKWFIALRTVAPFVQKPSIDAFIRLLIFVAAPVGAIDKAQVNAWMPTPTALADIERGDNFTRFFGLWDVTSIGALAFLKLGRDDDASELARLTVAPEQKTMKKQTLVACHSVLGQVAAKCGQLVEADEHFKRALGEATLSRLPMLEVLAVRDWKRHALKATGRDCGAAELTIDAACTKMGKLRAQLGSILV